MAVVGRTQSSAEQRARQERLVRERVGEPYGLFFVNGEGKPLPDGSETAAGRTKNDHRGEEGARDERTACDERESRRVAAQQESKRRDRNKMETLIEQNTSATSGCK